MWLHGLRSLLSRCKGTVLFILGANCKESPYLGSGFCHKDFVGLGLHIGKYELLFGDILELINGNYISDRAWAVARARGPK